MGNTFIINAPMLFRGLWKVAKAFLDERTRAKIKVLGGSYLPTLLEFVEAENLPDFLGGKNTEKFPSDCGPWSQYTLIDNKLVKKGDVAPEEEKKEEAKVEELPGG